MAVIGIYTKDFPDLGRSVLNTDIIPITEIGNVVTYKTTIADLMNSRITGSEGQLSKFGAGNTLTNSILKEIGNAIHLTNGGSSYASFGIINPGVPGEPGVDNDCYIGSTINNDFTFRVNNTEAGRFDTALRFKITNIPNAITDTDKFLVSDGGVIKYRTASEMISDLGVQGSIVLTTTGTSGVATFDGTTLNIPNYSTNLSGYVPYTGATSSINLGTNNGISMTINGTNSGIIVNTTSIGIGGIRVNNNGVGSGISSQNNSTGIGFYSYNPSSGQAFYIDNLSNGIAIKIENSATATGNPFVYTRGGASFILSQIDYLGNITGNSFIKSGGTSSQFLKADGSVDSNTYLTSSSLGNYVTLNTTQTITGEKSFTQDVSIRNGSGLYLNNTTNSNSTGLYTQGDGTSNIYIQIVQPKSGTIALTSDIHNPVTIGTANGLSLSGQVLSLGLASSINPGALSASDYLAFSNKQNALTVSSPLSISTGPTPNIAIQVATSSQNGYLSSTDFNNFNNKVSSQWTTSGSNIYYNSGNVGIGTASPLSKLHVNGDMRTVLTSGVGGDTLIAAINGVSNGYLINVDTSNNITHTWHTGGNVPSMRITSGGNVLIGTTTDDGAKLQVNGSAYLYSGSANTLACINTRNANGDSGCYIEMGQNANNTSSFHFIGAISGFGNKVQICGNGNIQNSNNSYGAISDLRFKKNVVDATPKLNDLLRVKIRNYNLVGDDIKQIGVVAQELEEIFPNMVDNSIDFDRYGNNLGTTTKTVKYSVFVPMLIKAIQEQQAQIEELKKLILNK